MGGGCRPAVTLPSPVPALDAPISGTGVCVCVCVCVCVLNVKVDNEI